jgi:25S rRNA (uracil2634-N3)-methyltransferase
LTKFFGSAAPLLKGGGEEGGGAILVTLFEGQPYELWNIRDLARHSGLIVRRSFAFKADAYPGYSHARTLGVVKKGGGAQVHRKNAGTDVEGDGDDEEDGDDEDGGREVSETAWKGELRAARTYEFGLKPEARSGETAGREFATGSNFTPLLDKGAARKNKNKGKGGDSDSDSD